MTITIIIPAVLFVFPKLFRVPKVLESALFDNSKQKSATKITDDNNKEDESSSGGEKNWKVFIRCLLRFEYQLPHPILCTTLATDKK